MKLPKIKKFWQENKFILIFLGVVALLRLPSLFEPYWYGDEGIYLTLGEGARRGLVFYRDLHDNKPPLLYLFAALAGSLFWFRFLLLVWSLATITLFYKLSKTFLSTQKNIKIATVVFGLFSTLPFLEGNIANAEIFMLLPTLAAIYLFFTRKANFKLSFSVGLLFSLATLFKIPAAFDFAALFAFALFFKKNSEVFSLSFQLKQLKQVYFPLIFGFLLPLLISLFYYWTQGALVQYWTAAFAQNLPYLSSWNTGSHSSFASSGLMTRGFLLLGFTSLVWFFRQKLSKTLIFTFIWFGFTLFAATLSGRPYPHYLLQALPPLALLTIVFTNPKPWVKRITYLSFSLLVITIVYFQFKPYATLSYYQNFIEFATNQKNQESYFKYFNNKVPRNYKLAQYLSLHTKPDEKVFIWGDSAMVYSLARRLPPGRYTASYHIIDFDGFEETINILKNNPPRYIIILGDEQRPFPQLESLISQDYLLVDKIEKAHIFYLSPQVAINHKKSSPK